MAIHLVMGACGHARVRETIFGGASRAVLNESAVPQASEPAPPAAKGSGGRKLPRKGRVGAMIRVRRRRVLRSCHCLGTSLTRPLMPANRLSPLPVISPVTLTD